MADTLEVNKEPIGSQPLEPGDVAYHLQYQRPSSDFPFERKFVEVHGVKMAYVDEGEGGRAASPARGIEPRRSRGIRAQAPRRGRRPSTPRHRSS